MRTTFTVVIWAFAGTAAAQMPATDFGYTGCLAQAGNIYAVAAGPQPLKACLQGDAPISLGDLKEIRAADGIEVETVGGVSQIKLDPLFQLPKACEPGSSATFNGTLWTCAAPPAPLRPPGHKVWIGVAWSALDRQPPPNDPFGRPRFHPEGGPEVATARIEILNPGSAANGIRVHWLGSDGALKKTTERTVPAGWLMPVYMDVKGIGWVVLTGDGPVLPTGYNRVVQHSFHAWNVDWYPLDCANPEGFEFACQLVQ